MDMNEDNIEKKGYDKNKEWYYIQEIRDLYRISKTICKKRLRLNKSLLIEGETIKLLKSNRGKKTHLYHFSILNDIFGVRNRPKNFKNRNDRTNFIGTSKWDYIGFLTPPRSTIMDLKYKMKYLYDQLVFSFGNKLGIILFYSIEPNPKDKYYHCHFLIYSKRKIEEISHLKSLLEIIGGVKSKDETPYILRQYDYLNFGYSGSFYSFKEKSVFDEYLN
jgi:hypothetical protein